MAISNLQEALLMYTKQKSMITNKINDIEMNLLAGTRKVTDLQAKYNQKEQSYYYAYSDGAIEKDEYSYICEQMEKEYEWTLQNINSWNQELEMQKDNYEAQYSEITQTETSYRSLLKQNLAKDFAYGGISQG